MKKFLISDLHIGHDKAQYDIMELAISYIRQHAESGDEIWGLGDWFHIDEIGFDRCIRHPMTQKFRDLAASIPTRLIPGNHDNELEKYRDNPGLVNPVSPITLTKPFGDNGIWYCHGHEFDPVTPLVPALLFRLRNKLFGTGKRTPATRRLDSITLPYLMAVYLVHSRALLGLQKKNEAENTLYRGIVLGHTHLPVFQDSPNMLFLFNDGDMRHSASFAVQDDTSFRLLYRISGQNQWQELFAPRP